MEIIAVAVVAIVLAACTVAGIVDLEEVNEHE